MPVGCTCIFLYNVLVLVEQNINFWVNLITHIINKNIGNVVYLKCKKCEKNFQTCVNKIYN
jgi:hypothetical protein